MDALVFVVDAQEEPRDVAVLLGYDVQALGGSCGTDQEEDAVVFLEINSDPRGFDLSDVFRDDGERFDVLRCYEVEAFEPVLFDLEGTDVTLLGVYFELFVGLLVLLVETHDGAVDVLSRIIQRHHVLVILLFVELVVDEGESLGLEGIVYAGLILGDGLPSGHVGGHFQSKTSMSGHGLIVVFVDDR